MFTEAARYNTSLLISYTPDPGDNAQCTSSLWPMMNDYVCWGFSIIFLPMMVGLDFRFERQVYTSTFVLWVIPSEKKLKKKSTPLKSWFFAWNITTGQINVELGAFGEAWRTQNCQFPHGTNFSFEMPCFVWKQLHTRVTQNVWSDSPRLVGLGFLVYIIFEDIW